MFSNQSREWSAFKEFRPLPACFTPHISSKLHNSVYSPSELEYLFNSRIKELSHLFASDIDHEVIRAPLEELCRDFLCVLLSEKPTHIQMSSANLYNFDTAILEMVRNSKYETLEHQRKSIESGPKEGFQSSHAQTMKAQNISGDFTELAQQKTELQSSKDSILKANLKIKKLEESIKTMRYQFMKELQNYKNQLFRAQKYPDNFEPIKVNYFSGLDNIDEQTTELLNKKIEQVGDDYNFKILRMQKHACSLEDKIMKFEKICREQNVGIKIDEMNADDIIYKLSIVENQSQPIWEAVTKHYGSGFFNKMIEKEFGINPDSHEEIGNRFGQEVSSIRIKANDSFNQLSSEMKVHIEGLKTRLRQKHTE